MAFIGPAMRGQWHLFIGKTFGVQVLWAFSRLSLSLRLILRILGVSQGSLEFLRFL